MCLFKEERIIGLKRESESFGSYTSLGLAERQGCRSLWREGCGWREPWLVSQPFTKKAMTACMFEVSLLHVMTIVYEEGAREAICCMGIYLSAWTHKQTCRQKASPITVTKLPALYGRNNVTYSHSLQQSPTMSSRSPLLSSVPY